MGRSYKKKSSYKKRRSSSSSSTRKYRQRRGTHTRSKRGRAGTWKYQKKRKTPFDQVEKELEYSRPAAERTLKQVPQKQQGTYKYRRFPKSAPVGVPVVAVMRP
jgi:hypothetical protein